MKNQPEFDRMIKLICSDFMGEYTIEGMWIKYKIPVGKKIGRFCTFNKETNKWESNQKEWCQRDSWTYVTDEDSKARAASNG